MQDMNKIMGDIGRKYGLTSLSKRYLPPGWLLIILATLLACNLGGAPATAIPVGLPSSYEVQTATPTRNPQQATAASQVVEANSELILSLGDAPTHTPDPNATPTLLPLPTATPILTITLTVPDAITQTVSLTPTIPPAPAKPRPVTTPAPPLKGGEWDFEGDFIPWPNPYGEPCPGARVASGWTAFVEDGQYGSSCMNENLYQPNVHSGLKSQEITFDFISANSGVLRTIPTQPGHRYTIVAHAKHDHSISPVQMALGVDFLGGTDWTAPSVQWFAWDNPAEDSWNLTEETVTATGEQLTIFIKGFHPQADQGGKTVIDNISVTDLGLE